MDDRRDLDNITKLRLDSWILQPAPRDQEDSVERESTVKKWHIKVEDRVYINPSEPIKSIIDTVY